MVEPPPPVVFERTLEEAGRSAPPDPGLGWLTRLAAAFCEAPVSLVVLFDGDASWWTSTYGIAPQRVPRDRFFSPEAALTGKAVVVTDMLADRVLARHPLVTGEPQLRSCVGVLLRAGDGAPLGALMVADTVARSFTQVQQGSLELLGRQAADHLEALRVQGERAATPDEDRLRHEAEMGRIVVRIQREVGELELGVDLPAVMTAMLERIRVFAEADGASIDFIEGGDLVCVAAAGVKLRPVGARRPFDQLYAGLAYAAVHDAKVQVCADSLADSRYDANFMRRYTVRSIIVAPLRTSGQAFGVIRVLANLPHAFSQHHAMGMEILAESFGPVIQQHRIAAQWRLSEAQYRSLFDSNPLPMLLTDREHHLLAANRAAVAHYGYSDAEFRAMHISDLWVPEQVSELRAALEVVGQRTTRDLKRQHRRKDGAVIDVEVTADNIEFAGRPARVVLVHDVTDRLQAERQLLRANRAQRMLGACIEKQLQVADEATLLKEVCRIAVELGGYTTAWVGYVRRQGEARSVVPVASVGDPENSLQHFSMEYSPEILAQSTRAGLRALRTGRVQVVEDFLALPPTESWAAHPLAVGLRSSVYVPLRGETEAIGLLNLNSAEPVQLAPEESELLQQIADDLAFGIRNLRLKDEQRALHAAVLQIGAAVSAAGGEAFFAQLVSSIAETLRARASVLARLPVVANAPARAMAVVVDGAPRDDFGFALAGSPSPQVYSQSHGRTAGNDCEGFIRQLLGEALPDGVCVWQRLDNSAGQPIGLILVLFDEAAEHTELLASTLRIFASRAAAEMERLESDRRIREQASLLDKAQDAIIVRSLEDRVLFWNHSAERLYGWTPEEVQGQPLSELLYVDVDVYQQAIRHVLALGEWSGELTHRRRDGSSLTVEGRWTLVRDEHGYPKSVLAINTDITQRKVTELQIQKLAFYDPLTELPNRVLLMERLQRALAASARSGRSGALLIIDLDNFKTLNDSLGHDRGDLLLQQVARRLAACVRAADTVARLGGDEFVVMLEQLGDNAQDIATLSRGVGDKILASLKEPFDLAGYEHNGTCSIGIAPFSASSADVSEVLKQADLAMYQSKTAGRNTLRFFDPEMLAAVTARTLLETDLRQALALDEFMLYYQPQVDAAGRAVGVEALLRWKHPQRGMVSPAVFIPLAEETGLIMPIGHWVLETACMLLAEWSRQPETAHLTIAVNVSSLQFRHPDFVEEVLSVLASTGSPAQTLKLELTESLLVDDMEAIIARMGALKAHGVCFSLDDFGTGYSSLSYLKRLPLDQLKIDQSFVRDLLTDLNDAAIVRTIIALAQTLGQNVIAEGVETERQKECLASYGCHTYQGYLFSRPLPLDQLQRFLQEPSPQAA